MKAKEALKVLNCSRTSLSNYIREGLISATKMENGRWDYDAESVYKFLNRNVERKTCIYARVSTNKQKNDLENQVSLLKQFCVSNGWVVSNVYSEIASGISFKDRKQFFELLDDILEFRVERVVIAYKDRLSRVGFELLYYLFKKYGCEIVVMSDIGNGKLDSDEVIDDVMSLLRGYSTNICTKERVDLIKRALQ